LQRAFQPRNGSIGIAWERGMYPPTKFQPRNGSIGIPSPWMVDDFHLVSTPQRFDWNITPLAVRSGAVRFNPATVRLEFRWETGKRVPPAEFQPRNGSIGIFRRMTMPQVEYVSTPQRFDWNYHGESHRIQGHCFNPATVRLEFGNSTLLQWPRRFQPRNGSIGIRQAELVRANYPVSTPQRFDWNNSGNLERQSGNEGFNPATVRLEFSAEGDIPR